MTDKPATTPGLDRQKGPIEILCEEIDLRFERELEEPAMLVAFVRMLVNTVEEDQGIRATIAHVTGNPPSEGSSHVLAAAKDTCWGKQLSRI